MAVIQLIFGCFSAVGEEDISTVYANCIAGSREQREASSTVRLPIYFVLYPKIKACIGLHDLAPPARNPQPYSFFRRYSKTTYPIRAEIIAMKKFVPVKMSFKANVKLFPGPLVAVNSPIKRLE
jgi:hypothetical protein